MSLAVSFVEIYKESRTVEVDSDNVTRKMILFLEGNFWDESDEMDFFGKTDDETVYNWLIDNIPWFMTFKIGPYYAILMLSGCSLSQEGPDGWRAELVYEMPENASSTTGQENLDQLINNYNLNDDESWTDEFTQVSVNSTVEKVHVTTSLQLVEIQKAKWVPAGIAVPDGLVVGRPAPIGMTNNEIKGGDRYDEVFTFQVTQYFNPRRLTYKYIRKLRSLAGRVNNARWFGFPRGSVLYKGHQAQGNLIQNIPVTFDFEVKNNFKFSDTAEIFQDPDETVEASMYDQILDENFDPSVSSFMGLGVHSGHTLVDYLYLPVPDAAAKTKTMRPAFRLIHRMQNTGDFRILGL